MRRKRLLIVVGLAVVAATVALLGVAAAEGPAGSTSARSVDVEGVGVVPIPLEATAAQATTVYREGQAKAIADGQAKAQFIAEKEGVALGVPTLTVEDGGSIECNGAIENEYLGYRGEQPDFGYARTTSSGFGVAAPPAASGTANRAAPHVSHRPKGKKKHTAKKASLPLPHCNLTAELTLVYALG